MKYASSRLIGYGVVICAVGVLLQRVGTDLVSLIFGSLAQPNAIMERGKTEPTAERTEDAG